MTTNDPGSDRPMPHAGQPHEPQNQGVVPQGEPVYPTYPQVAHGQPFGHPRQDTYPPGYPGQQYPQQGYQPYGYGQPAYPYGYAQPYPPPPAKARRGVLGGLVALFVAAAVVFAAVAFATSHRASDVSGQGTALPSVFGGSASGGSASGGSGNGGSSNGGYGSGGTGSGGSSGFGSTNTGTGKRVASSAEQAGVVTIVSVLKYQNAESAGTGTILTSNGEILTNNHVVNGATSITVTVASTGRSYKASVVGTAPTKDIAVLQLQNASGLTTANYATSASGVTAGDAVTGVGNAGGTATLTAASGKVVALNQSITATDETGTDAERLHGLIEINAPIISGDSGGPLYDSNGQMIGIDTAASSNQTTTTRAYAITIDNAMSVAGKIESGVETTTIHIGLPGFLGIAPTDATNGVVVGAVEAGLPAAKAGITDGSTITSVGRTAITSSTQLHNVLAAAGPGDKVAVSWTDARGASHTATITLATGPAD